MENKKNNIWWILGSIGLIILLLLGSYIAFRNENSVITDTRTEVSETIVDEALDNSPDQVKYVYYSSLAKDYIRELQEIVKKEPEMTIDEILAQVDEVEYQINTTLDEIPEDTTDTTLNALRAMFTILSKGAANVYATVDTGDIEGGVELIHNNIAEYNKLIPSVEPYYSEAE